MAIADGNENICLTHKESTQQNILWSQGICTLHQVVALQAR